MSKEFLKENGYIIQRVTYDNGVTDSVIVKSDSKLLENLEYIKMTRSFAGFAQDVFSFGTDELGRPIEEVEKDMIEHAVENLK